MGSGGFFYSSCLKGEAFPVDFLLFLQNLQILPMGSVRHFRRIHKNDALFLKMCVFREKIHNLCVFRKHMLNLLVFREHVISTCPNFPTPQLRPTAPVHPPPLVQGGGVYYPIQSTQVCTYEEGVTRKA